MRSPRKSPFYQSLEGFGDKVPRRMIAILYLIKKTESGLHTLPSFLVFRKEKSIASLLDFRLLLNA